LTTKSILVIALMAVAFGLGFCAHYFLGREVVEVEVINAEKTLDLYVSVLREYYNFTVTERDPIDKWLFGKGDFDDYVEILTFDSWVRFLKTNNFAECFYTYENGSKLWVVYERCAYYWKMKE